MNTVLIKIEIQSTVVFLVCPFQDSNGTNAALLEREEDGFDVRLWGLRIDPLDCFNFGGTIDGQLVDKHCHRMCSLPVDQFQRLLVSAGRMFVQVELSPQQQASLPRA